MIEKAKELKDFNASSYLENIQNYSLENKVEINIIVSYLLNTETNQFKKNILNILAKYYPITNLKYYKIEKNLHKIKIEILDKTIGTSIEKIINNNNKPRIKNRPTKLASKAGNK